MRTSCRNGCQADCDDCILDCESGCPDCVPFRKIGESCIPLLDRCDDGLACQILPSTPGGDAFICLPAEDENLADDESCRAVYSRDVHQAAIDTNTALSFGTGTSVAGVAGASAETGAVYGPDGEYGCYVTTCLGATSDAEIGSYASVGFYLSYEDFQGESIAFVEEAGEIVGFVTSQVFNLTTGGLPNELIGTADCLSFELSLLPIAIGTYDCTTVVDTAGYLDANGNLVPYINNPPMAVCADTVVCADEMTGLAGVSIDGGSSDPDGDTLTLVQTPSSPYDLGDHTVALEVTDTYGESDTCTAQVTVEDCTSPTPMPTPTCGSTGPVTLFGLAVGLMVLSRFVGTPGRRRV